MSGNSHPRARPARARDGPARILVGRDFKLKPDETSRLNNGAQASKHSTAPIIDASIISFSRAYFASCCLRSQHAEVSKLEQRDRSGKKNMTYVVVNDGDSVV